MQHAPGRAWALALHQQGDTAAKFPASNRDLKTQALMQAATDSPAGSTHINSRQHLCLIDGKALLYRYVTGMIASRKKNQKLSDADISTSKISREIATDAVGFFLDRIIALCNQAPEEGGPTHLAVALDAISGATFRLV